MKPMQVIISIAATVGILGFGSVYATGTVAKNRAIDVDTARNFAYIDAGVTPEQVLTVSTEFEREKGQYIYDIEFTTDTMKYEYDIKASDGTVLSSEKETLQTAQKSKTQKADVDVQNVSTTKTEEKASDQVNGRESADDSAQKYISVDDAKNKAVGSAGLSIGDVTFSKAKLEDEDGHIIYDMEFYTDGAEYEYEIDAVSGVILESSKESFAGNHKETGAVATDFNQTTEPESTGAAATQPAPQDTGNTAPSTPAVDNQPAQQNSQVYIDDDDDWDDDDDRDDDDEDDDD